jgi:hypothetical protein
MATMLEVVEDALEELGVKTAEIPLTSDELQSGIRRVNDMLAEWSDSGITPGYNPVLSGSDELNIDRNAVAAVKYNAAIRLAPSFQKVVQPALSAVAMETKIALEASSVYIGEVAYPDTLPLGSGNECDHFDARFFATNKSENF